MKFRFYHLLGALALGSFFLAACQSSTSSAPVEREQNMQEILASVQKKLYSPHNGFSAEARLAYVDSLLKITTQAQQIPDLQRKRAGVLLEFGDEKAAVAIYEQLLGMAQQNPEALKIILMDLGIAYMRLAERSNCVNIHPAGACIMPIQGDGIHNEKIHGQKAFDTFLRLLDIEPQNLDARWLLNIAAMTIGEYPDKLPKKWLIPGLDRQGNHAMKPFLDAASALGIATHDRSGGSIVDDFDNDGYLDIVTSAWGLDDPMHYYHNNGDGTFSDYSNRSGLDKIFGGLNINQTDYNNDGYLDIFVMRGGWQGMVTIAEQPNSLLKNNGDGTFTDVTVQAGLLSFHPTQTSCWNDFNNDGWLDLFIGNETTSDKALHPCELYLNNQNGTFTNVATPDRMNIQLFVKGVTSGDYDQDGRPDLFLSTMDGRKLLLRNRSTANQREPVFEDVTAAAGLANETYRSFPTWFWDYDNDGWLDLLICNYEFDAPLSSYAAKAALGEGDEQAGKIFVYKNNQTGAFTNVTKALGLQQVAFAMGSNFGDLNNDGYLDFYLGTGNPSYKSLIPNKLFMNVGGKRFADATASSRTGSLQKGHAVSIADIDNDGDQDIHEDMGGAYKGDAYFSALYLNPGQNTNNWISIKLVGVKSNRPGIGAKVTIYFTENGKKRMVYREVNSGGSFGCSPFRRDIGVGAATVIDEVVIRWPNSREEQRFQKVPVNQFIKVTEGATQYERVSLKNLPMHAVHSIPMCKPAS